MAYKLLGREELERAFQLYWRTGAVGEDWDAWADLFTEDCTYFEHWYGQMQGRETVRKWIDECVREADALDRRESGLDDKLRGQLQDLPELGGIDPEIHDAIIATLLLPLVRVHITAHQNSVPGV